MIKARPKYPTDLYGTIYIDNIQKAVVICLIIPTIFPFDAISCIPGCMTYIVHPGSSIKRKCCRNVDLYFKTWILHIFTWNFQRFIVYNHLILNTKRGNDIWVGNPGTSLGQAQMSCGVCRLVESQPSPLDMCC
jgi:hypothetical protein